MKANLNKFEFYILSLWFLFVLIIVVTIDIPIYFGEDWQFIGFRKLFENNVIPLVSLFFVALGIHSYFKFDYEVSGSKSLPVEISSIEDMNYEHLTFLTTYIIPLICFNLASVRYAIALGLLLIVIGIIYIETDKFYANPTLAVLGFKLYRADLITRTGSKSKIVLITKDILINGDQVRCQMLDEKVYYAGKVE